MLRQELAQLLNMSLLMIDKSSNQDAAGQISQSLFFARDNLLASLTMATQRRQERAVDAAGPGLNSYSDQLEM